MTTEDFKVYRTNWIPGLGHAFGVVTFERDRELYPSTERFFVAPTEPLHFEHQRFEYNGIASEIQSDESLWNQQLEALQGALIEFLHDHRASFGPLYYDIATSIDWYEVPRQWLTHYNLRNALPGQLAPALSQIRETTESTVLQEFLDQYRGRASREWSLRVKPKKAPPVNVELLSSKPPQT